MIRLDKQLHLQGFAKSRTQAAELIKNNSVTVNGTLCSRCSLMVSQGDVIAVVADKQRYVSRGGIKLEYALDCFGFDLTGLVCLDAGASTGGFTDCMLQHSARKVYAVDVGTSQLDPVLRGDKRVISIENCDIRDFVPPERIDFVSVDVSFISLKLILAYIKTNAVVLIKPQFELGKKHSLKKGVITDTKLQDSIVRDITEFARNLGFMVKDVVESPIKGGSGNREFLMGLER
jgi:23S rRNA (cytidine1920-2'-O)/16S rRNA (cytidine1409-2'-O)-methyltransferase